MRWRSWTKGTRQLTDGKDGAAARAAFQASFKAMKERRIEERAKRTGQRQQRIKRLETLISQAESLSEASTALSGESERSLLDAHRKAIDELRATWKNVGSLPRDVVQPLP